MLEDHWGPGHGKPFSEWSIEDHQVWQTDYVAQKGQGDISLHSEEHLMAGDKGTALSRRMFRQLAERVAEGEDPFGAGANEPYRVEILAEIHCWIQKRENVLPAMHHVPDLWQC